MIEIELVVWFFDSFLTLLLSFCEFFDSIDAVSVKIATYLNFAILGNKSEIESKTNKRKRRTFGTFSHKSTETNTKKDPS